MPPPAAGARSPAGPPPAGSGPARDPDRGGHADPGLARERTRLAWSRTAIAFAALGGVMLRRELAAGLLVLASTPLIWVAGRFASPGTRPAPRPGRLLVVTVAVTVVSVLAVIVALVGSAPANLDQLLPLHG